MVINFTLNSRKSIFFDQIHETPSSIHKLQLFQVIYFSFKTRISPLKNQPFVDIVTSL